MKYGLFFYLPSLFVVVILCSRLTIYLNNMRWWFYDLFSLRGCDSMLSSTPYLNIWGCDSMISPHSLPNYLRLWFCFLFSLPSLLFEVVILWSLLTIYLIIWGCDFVFSFTSFLTIWGFDSMISSLPNYLRLISLLTSFLTI